MTSSALTVAKALEALPEVCPGVRTWVVAYSGGRDSTALLHATRAFAAQRGDAVRAVHVNHGLQPAARDFEQHCAAVCREWGIPLERMQREADPTPGLGPEAQAREIRYQALRRHARHGVAILLAHHRDDQAETLLLQLLRGAGVAGTAAMPLCRDWGEGKLVRPLLDVSRQEIEDYVHNHRLTFMEDPSNFDTGIERNFLRREVLPLLEERWPSASQTLARSARHHAHAARLLQERAEQDLDDADTIEVEFLASLSQDRQINLVRFWIARQGSRSQANGGFRGGWTRCTLPVPTACRRRSSKPTGCTVGAAVCILCLGCQSCRKGSAGTGAGGKRWSFQNWIWSCVGSRCRRNWARRSRRTLKCGCVRAGNAADPKAGSIAIH